MAETGLCSQSLDCELLSPFGACDLLIQTSGFLTRAYSRHRGIICSDSKRTVLTRLSHCCKRTCSLFFNTVLYYRNSTIQNTLVLRGYTAVPKRKYVGVSRTLILLLRPATFPQYYQPTTIATPTTDLSSLACLAYKCYQIFSTLRLLLCLYQM